MQEELLLTQGIRRVKSDVYEVAPGVVSIRIVFVNVMFIYDPNNLEHWVLVDTGLKGFSEKIIREAEERFGMGTQPQAIVLTHGHFDHRGALKELLEVWDVPVLAHRLEIPYLSGQSSYPPADPTVGGGLMALMGPIYPNDPITVGDNLQELPADGAVPFLPEWRYLHTPGHAPGHISLFRENDRTLIAGDAFVTTDQESLLSVMLQAKIIHGPPSYFTTDWQAANNSVLELAALHPQTVVTGHGAPMAGPEMESGLHELATHFRELAVPAEGRYVREPAIADEYGTVYVPPVTPFWKTGLFTSAVILGLAGAGLVWMASCLSKSKAESEA